MIPAVDGLAAFGPAVVAAVLIAAYLVLGEPWAGAVLHRRFEVALTRDRHARLWLYRRLLILEWGLVTLVAGVVLVAPDVSWSQLGLRLPDRAPGALAVALAVFVLAVLVLTTGMARTSARRQPQEGSVGALGSTSVVALVPRTALERRWFALVAVTAGWCEEVLYRGFFLAVVVAVVPDASDLALVLLSAVAFGAAHAYQGTVGVLTTGVLGAILAYVYVGTGTLLAPILLHAAIDLRILWVPRSILPPRSGRVTPAAILGLRLVADADSSAVVGLIGGCFAEYPGCVLDLPGIDAWMRAPATSYAREGGEFWVVERDRAVVACVGYRPGGSGSVELKSLYVGAAARREGLGGRLVALVEHTAADLGARRVSLWTDTRFADAHRLYERLGYLRVAQTRELHDPSQSVEYGYVKDLAVAGAR